jgi:hypothetical protein
VTAVEAPIAYQMSPDDDGFGPGYDIRSFDGKFWWSLADTAFAPSVEHYIGSVTDSGSCFLSMMNLSPASIDSPRQTTALFNNDMSIRRILKSSKDERWILANRVANRVPGQEMFEHAAKLNFEGIVSKRADAPYRSERTEAWLKIKTVQEANSRSSGL